MEDKSGEDYSAFGSFRTVNEIAESISGVKLKTGPGAGYGYIISSNAGFTSSDTIFLWGQNIYFKIWSDDIDYSSISKAEWHIFKVNQDDQEPWRLLSSIHDDDIITVQLSNSNTESIGRLLMSNAALAAPVFSQMAFPVSTR